MDSRRNHLKIIGAIGASCAFPFAADELYGQQEQPHVHPAPTYKAPVTRPFEPKFFTAAEGLAIVKLSDLIIPKTDTPGASEAGVPQYIDDVVAKNPELQTRFRDGLVSLDKQAQAANGKKFVDLDEHQQIALLQPISDALDAGRAKEPGPAFFASLKGLTADGYYTSYAGLVQELGYKGNQALASFPGCTHETHEH